MSIFEQLQLEEALLRNSRDNWCLLNTEAPEAVVMGISGDPTLLVHPDRLHYPLIRRYSGGGTVLIDPHTILVTFICNTADTGVAPYPAEVHAWALSQLQPHLPITLRENDYVIGPNKVGGNAQYLAKGRWVHHTSLLWDFDPHKMEVLKLPPKQPSYREQRPHTSFLTTLKPLFPCKNSLLDTLALGTLTPLSQVKYLLTIFHRQSTSQIQ